MAKTTLDKLRDGTIRLHDKKKERFVWFTPGDITEGGCWVSTASGNRVFIDRDEINEEWEVG